jgi:hypothetical protein
MTEELEPIDNESLDELIFDHLCEEQPEVLEGLSDDEIRRRVSLGIAKARGYGFESPGAATAFVTLLFLVDPAFDRQPNIARVLSDTKIPPDQRMKRLFSLTKEEDWDAAAAQSSRWPA